MRQKHLCKIAGAVFGAWFLCLALPCLVRAENQSRSLLTVTEESQIRPISDGSEKYILKSDGFYCLDAAGTVDQTPAVHYFDRLEIGGTTFQGYYYHDESGKFRAGSPYIVHIKGAACQDTVFDGFFMVNNLGRLTAAPQVRYIDKLNLDGGSFDGYYYFNENGRLVTEAGVHYLSMNCNGRRFEGYYYFGGENGCLVTEAGVTPEGFAIDENGKMDDSENVVDALEERLETMISAYEGTWSIYVKNPDTGETISINNQALPSASLIKLFVMEKTFADMDRVRENEAKLLNASADSDTVQKKIDELLWNMITVSDNESYNELVRLQTESYDFIDGAKDATEYLEEEQYTDTRVSHTLHPSGSEYVGVDNENNITSVEDCGRLLEKIYFGECVSSEASEQMLELLLNQEVVWKIPAGISDDVVIANKTGETDSYQHDAAIVYGSGATYIICVMSEGCPENTAVENIRDISGIVYNYMNLTDYQAVTEDSQGLTEAESSEELQIRTGDSAYEIPAEPAG